MDSSFSFHPVPSGQGGVKIMLLSSGPPSCCCDEAFDGIWKFSGTIIVGKSDLGNACNLCGPPARGASNCNRFSTSAPSTCFGITFEGLLDRFISTAIRVAESLDGAYDSLKEIKTLLSAVHAAVLLELVPHITAFEVQEHDNVSIDRIPILVVAASFSLADCEKKGNRLISASLTQLLRSLGSYLTSLLAMLNPAMPLHVCDKLARYYKRRGVLDDITAMKLETVPTATSLKGLAIALEASKSNMENFAADINSNSLGKYAVRCPSTYI